MLLQLHEGRPLLLDVLAGDEEGTGLLQGRAGQHRHGRARPVHAGTQPYSACFSAACCLTELEHFMLKPCGALCCAVLLLFAVQARLLVPSTALRCTWGC